MAWMKSLLALVGLSAAQDCWKQADIPDGGAFALSKSNTTFMCLTSQGDPSTLLEQQGEWCCITADGCESRGAYAIYQELFCGQPFSSPRWEPTDAYAPVPEGDERIYSKSGAMPCRKKDSVDSVGAFKWNDKEGRWECSVLGGKGSRTSLFFIPDVELLFRKQFGPAAVIV
eukprot:TRINITY_DN44154_c0_g1_i1.p1 TRINITY_DN44154_c0_g1~~TRINITY_DN44154_c0_g1_i1.p1  ORF type:complete len:172 (-),score=28.99 TRINITY_DN44154_c0_g1_i1:147-662(-)